MALFIKQNELEQMMQQSHFLDFQTDTLSLKGEELLRQLKSREEAFLTSQFGINITQQELRNNLKIVQQKAPILNKLTGIEMRKIINLFNAHLPQSNAEKEELMFQKVMQEEWNSWINNNNLTNAEDALIEDFLLHIAEQTYSKIPEITIGDTKHSGKITSLVSFREGGSRSDITKINEVFLADLSDVLQKRIRYFMKNIKGERIGDYKLTTKNSSTLVIEPTFDWWQYSKGRKASDVSQSYATRAAQQFKEDFLNTFNPDNQVPYMPKILDTVLQNPKRIFTGASDTQIIGICGEVQALCYLSLLMGDKFQLDSQVQWMATKTFNGKQAHSDIAILQQYGIQVKNTVNDIVGKIDFVNSTLYTFLQNLVSQNVITEQIAEGILNIYEAKEFNIPYKMTYDDMSGRAIESPNDRFKRTRDKILILYEAYEAILNELIGQLMYIGTGEAFKNESSNILFFLGKHIVFASEIVEKLLQESDKQKDFLVQIYNKKSAFNIVNVINNTGRQVFNYPGIVAFYEQDLINSIYLKSSYDFSSIINKIYH